MALEPLVVVLICIGVAIVLIGVGVFVFLKKNSKNSYLIKVDNFLKQIECENKSQIEAYITRLKNISNNYKCVDKTELLAFRKICQVKYDKLGIKFPFEHISEPTKEEMAEFNEMLR